MTLVEVLVALVLLVIGLFGILDFYLGLAHRLEENRHRMQADYLLQERLASLQMLGYPALEDKIKTLASPADTASASLFPDAQKSTVNPDFFWNADLLREESDGVRRIRVTVKVAWSEKQQPRDRKAVDYVFAP
jgi:Tfp pilus assembly protein PilV